MKQNHKIFDDYNEFAHQFYQEHGWVVVSSSFDKMELQGLNHSWQQLYRRYATEIGCSVEDYLKAVSQWRNLWQVVPVFHDALKKSAIVAAKSFGLTGARLLHDHIISKSTTNNGEIPWHQDSMYWPVDRTGMSVWMSFYDVSVMHGCLEVIDKSHQWGASRPIDFMSKEHTPASDAEATLLPAAAGSMILLHSRTWHRSQPIHPEMKMRPALISLWVPPLTCYYPKNAEWHPINEQITVSEHEVLNDNEFPVFGDKKLAHGNTEKNCHEGVPSPHGMFNARVRIQKEISRLLSLPKNQEKLSDILSTKEQRERLLDTLINKHPKVSHEELRQLINLVWISSAAYELHRSRNVFNSAYARWESLTRPL